MYVIYNRLSELCKDVWTYCYSIKISGW